MKPAKKYLAVLMAISILLCSIIAITSSAADSSQGESEAEIEELQPMMANQCSYVKFNDKMANTVAQYHGYAGAEAFKLDYGVTSNANMYRNTVTGEIVLITNTGAVINTGLYGGWN